MAALPASAAEAKPAAQPQFCAPDLSVAALDQYCEAVPGAGGPVSSQVGGRPGSSKPLGSVLPRREVARLRMDAAGRALLLLPVIAPIGASPAARAERRLVRPVARRVSAENLGAKPVDPQTLAAGLAKAGDAVLSGTFRWGLLVCTLGFAGIGWLRIRAKL